jgi:hypothetical protein
MGDYIPGVPEMMIFYRRLPKFNYLALTTPDEALSLLSRKRL